MTIIRAAMTETKNVYGPMPDTVDELDRLAGKLEAIRAANVDHHVTLARTAAAAGVELIGFGELFTMPYFALGPNPMWLDAAEDAETGPTVSQFREIAAELELAIVCPIYEADDALRFDTAVVIDAAGEIAGKYRKTHIPAGANEQNTFCETYYYGPALDEDIDELFPVFDMGEYQLGVAICYDRHFTGVMRALADGGAEIVLSPAVSFGEKSERMWQLEFEVDACRENIFIGGSNRRGAEKPWNQEYFGSSYFVGPNGRPPVIDVHPELVVADLDLSELRAPDPSGWDLERDRRL